MLEKPLRCVGSKVNDFRNRVEMELREASGKELTIWQLKRVRTACTCMREYGRAARRMRLADEDCELTHEQWLAYSKHLMTCEAAADRALESLGLDKPPPDIWDAFHNQRAPIGSSSAAASEITATQATPEPSKGEIACPGANGAIPESADGGKVALTPVPRPGSPNEWHEGDDHA
jgi:hypothetical protein